MAPPEAENGGLKTDQAKKLKELEKENARLKKLLATTKLYDRRRSRPEDSPTFKLSY